MPSTRFLSRPAWGAAVAVLLHAGPAAAQYAAGPSIDIEAATEDRRRGLGWSDGHPVVRGSLSVPVAPGLSLDGAATTLWGGDRHGDADAALDIGATFVRQIGGWRLSAEGRYHLFPGAAHRGYGEVGVTGGFLLGPASIDVGAHYAPRQSAIGGDNLYVSTGAAFALPGTPLTLSAHLGRSTGNVHNQRFAARLRPGGGYWDHGVALDWYRGHWSLGLRYTDTDIVPATDAHAGATLIATAGFSL
ncbi:hypothetical protein J3E64_002388 [Sphingobium sp. OAS761]|uniref:TorF family putative porin n=1 Tax=Sphingobium sp. OAS761 TaxID=2817901 RepID=UPI0020A156C0|nr:TorF family putative porin [Sphingobium sp. OAS761]MCP1470695.1 hypothetical protein [Sphingobium sp. OAS761]